MIPWRPFLAPRLRKWKSFITGPILGHLRLLPQFLRSPRAFIRISSQGLQTG